MKKLYSIIAIAATVAVSAQGTENLDSQAATAGSSYTTVNFNGAANTTWTFATTRMVDTAANYNISGTSALLNANGTATITFPEGLGNLQFQYKKAFTGGTARSIQVTVNGTLLNTTPSFGSGSGAQTTIYDYTAAINTTTSTTVEIKVLGAQTTLDNFSWTAPVLGTATFDASKVSLVKNSIVGNDITFGAKSGVKIFNMNGQLVKSANVAENTVLNISELAKGTYIVAGEVNGKAVSQKIIKK